LIIITIIPGNNTTQLTKMESSTNMNNTQILLELRRIFQQHLLVMDLHLHNNEKKMMDMLRKDSGKNWETNLILSLAQNNKINWVHGSDDPIPMKPIKKK